MPLPTETSTGFAPRDDVKGPKRTAERALPPDSPEQESEATLLLGRVAEGDAAASERLAELVYAELKGRAARLLRGEREAQSIDPTLLAHEAWLRIVPTGARRAQDRAHFLAIAARAMRQVLVEHGRARGRRKRGGDLQRVSLAEVPAGEAGAPPRVEVLDLNRTIEELARLHARAARVVEMRAFGGLTTEEAAGALEVSHRTVEDDWAFAKAWLSRALRRR